MQRKPGFPVANCNIKIPDGLPLSEPMPHEDEREQQQRRLQLINFGHSQWGFNNWSWSVSKQELDFVDFTNGKYVAGVVAFVCVTLKGLDIHRENVGYATCVATTKGMAIYQARKCAVTNALRETLLSFGGNVATELLDIMEAHREVPEPQPQPQPDPNIVQLAKNHPKNIRTDSSESPHSSGSLKNAPVHHPPVVKPHPMPANLPPPPQVTRPSLPANLPRPPPAPAFPVPPPHVRPNSNVSYVLQPVMPQLYAPPPRMPHVQPPPHFFPNTYYEYSGPWHLTYDPYDRPHGNVNLNFNMPPKNLVVNSRGGTMECKRPDEAAQYGPPPTNQGCWIKPTIFYDGFWTEQKVKKWVAEQVEKQFPEDGSHKSPSPSSGQPDSTSKP